eukprot:COSAG04_NODE_675_length_11271_cov_4.894289_5_plen_108_part_00
MSAEAFIASIQDADLKQYAEELNTKYPAKLTDLLDYELGRGTLALGVISNLVSCCAESLLGVAFGFTLHHAFDRVGDVAPCRLESKIASRKPRKIARKMGSSFPNAS